MPMTRAYNLWVKWIALEIDQTDESQINSNGNDVQSHHIQRFTAIVMITNLIPSNNLSSDQTLLFF